MSDSLPLSGDGASSNMMLLAELQKLSAFKAALHQKVQEQQEEIASLKQGPSPAAAGISQRDENSGSEPEELLVSPEDILKGDVEVTPPGPGPRPLILTGMSSGAYVPENLKLDIWDNKYVDLARLLYPLDEDTQDTNIRADVNNGGKIVFWQIHKAYQ